MDDNFLQKELKDPAKLLVLLKTKTEDFWIRRGEKMALRLFHLMSRKVPAYKDFLKKKKINPAKIKTISDFKQIPLVDKNNYLRAYPLNLLCWEEKLSEGNWVYSTTSGSTGEPFYFPRQDLQDIYYAITAEIYLLSNFEIDKKTTLYIDSFAMGPWIGGLFTYQALKILAKRGGYNLSIITTGVSKEEIIKAVRSLAKNYDQIIIGGYPPFVKDAIDYGLANGIHWRKYNLGFVFSAEGFSEAFRDYIIKKTGLKDVYKSTLNHYGTVDLGTMSHETPLCVLVRRMALRKNSLYKRIFSDAKKLPTLTQYIPEMFYFEDLDSNLVCSSYSGLPLVRYDLKDHGGIITLNQVVKNFSSIKIDLKLLLKKTGIDDSLWNLPFVYIYERSDFSVSISGANVYPETIRKALLDNRLQKYLTGKFTMLVKHDKKQNPYLEINIELMPKVGQTPFLKDLARTLIMNQLLKENSEYNVLHQHMPERVIPQIIFWSYEDQLYFKSGGKQKWVKK